MSEWHKIPGWENYEINRDGIVRSVDRIEKFINGTRLRKGRVMKVRLNTQGYPWLHFKSYGKVYGVGIHRLLALVFIPNPDNKPYVAHLDHNPLNYSLDNLMWTTQKENIAQSVAVNRHCHGETHGCHKLTESDVRRIRSFKKAHVNLCSEYGISYSTVKRIRSRKIWKHVA